MNFKVGDKVRIVKNDIFSEEVHVGDVATIIDIDINVFSHYELTLEFDNGLKQVVCQPSIDSIELVDDKSITTHTEFFKIANLNKLVLIEDGTLRDGDVEKLEQIGFTVIVYKQGHKPKIINLKGECHV